MARHLIVVAEPIHEDGLRILERAEGVDTVLLGDSSSNPSLAEVTGEANAILVRIAKIDRSMIEGSPSLKIIAKHGVGYDNIDIKTATEKRIPVTFTPGSNSNTVAEHTIGFLLLMAKNLCFAHTAVKNGTFTKRESFTGKELCEKSFSKKEHVLETLIKHLEKLQGSI